ncbi:transcription factor Opi1-domain-containing protein [Fimicolochytrium jonesii]|uniref:transcription factor Opi1-domain-containing protein n=1 Tax=Fimicolochytrium jonesii TaxID=1396493 RepID=UPI0022FDFF45|nr:transcription factor Opi1-domain-containing protein [Fimicolochytrium jonesii]KAI8817027.1 transcription factor Opi1-domain-containing protein [Fimicolochytrium jonesii]
MNGGGANVPTKYNKQIPNPLHLPNDILQTALPPPNGHAHHKLQPIQTLPHSQSQQPPHIALSREPPVHSGYSSQTASTQSSPMATPVTPTMQPPSMFSIGTSSIHTSYNHHAQNRMTGEYTHPAQQQQSTQNEQQQQQHHSHHHQGHHLQQPYAYHTTGGRNGDVEQHSHNKSYSNGVNGHGDMQRDLPNSTATTPTQSARSTMSINDLCNNSNDDAARDQEVAYYYNADPDVQMAAEALGGLRNGDMGRRPIRQSSQEHFMQRVQNIPLVNKSINQLSTAYEATKNASRVVKYSAESVETGVKTITKPVFNRLEPALAPLDRFACTQLDKLEKSFPSIMGSSPPPSGSYDAELNGPPRIEYNPSRPRSLSTSSMSSVSSMDLLQPPNVPLLDARSPQLNGSHAPPPSPGGTIPGPPLTNALAPPASPGIYRPEEGPITTAPHIDRKPRSRWHQVVAGVGGSLSGLMLSDETMRGLKYCLQWLQYATDHIDRQVQVLRDYLARAGGSVAAYLTAGSSASQPTPPLSPQANDMTVATAGGNNLFTVMAAIRREVVETLRRVVDVIGRYAALYLPGEARRTVRGFILALPGRWATLTHTTPGSSTGLDADAEAQKVLTLATESSTMLKGVQSIFAETVDGAERFGRNVGPASDVSDPFANGGGGSSSSASSTINGGSYNASGSSTPTFANATVNGNGAAASGGTEHPLVYQPDLSSATEANTAVAVEPSTKRRKKRSGGSSGDLKSKGKARTSNGMTVDQTPRQPHLPTNPDAMDISSSADHHADDEAAAISPTAVVDHMEVEHATASSHQRRHSEKAYSESAGASRQNSPDGMEIDD